jgi:WhiB family redox-sensing transcriptional regulator
VAAFDPRFDDEPPPPPLQRWRHKDKLECEPELVHGIAETIAVPRWHRAAACRGADSAIFFLGPGQPATEAKAPCAGCPVQSTCLGWAIEAMVPCRIFGGMNDRERRGKGINLDSASLKRKRRMVRIQ